MKRASSTAAPAEDNSLPARLHQLAEAALACELGAGPEPATAADPELAARGTTAVTLLLDGKPHGSHASLRRTRSLADDIVFNVRAALADERHPPLSAAALPALSVSVALQSEAEFLEFDDEAGLLAQLEPGVHGLHLFACCRNVSQGPQAWREHPQPAAFLAALKEKAGLAGDHPLAGMMVARYTVSSWPLQD